MTERLSTHIAFLVRDRRPAAKARDVDEKISPRQLGQTPRHARHPLGQLSARRRPGALVTNFTGVHAGIFNSHTTATDVLLDVA